MKRQVQITYLDVESKWKNYARYIQPILQNSKKIIEDGRLNDSLSLILVTPQEIHRLNKQFRNIDRATDVLTFVDGEDHYLGDIFINVDAIVSQAKDYGHSIKREFCFLFTHGLLHLLGYDHHKKSEEELMFSTQERILEPIAPRYR